MMIRLRSISTILLVKRNIQKLRVNRKQCYVSKAFFKDSRLYNMVVRLHYTNGRGLSEVIRITLGAAEIQFEESFIETKEDFDKIKNSGKSLFGQVPLLEIDGLYLSESLGIVRYICSKHGWHGKTAAETARIEMLSYGARDMYWIIMNGFKHRISTKEDKPWKEALQKLKDKYFPVFDKEIKSSGSGYLVGDSLTMCDLVFLDALTWVAESESEFMKEFPNIMNFLTTVTSHPGIGKFLSGPQRKPVPDAEYLEKLVSIYGSFL